MKRQKVYRSLRRVNADALHHKMCLNAPIWRGAQSGLMRLAENELETSREGLIFDKPRLRWLGTSSILYGDCLRNRESHYFNLHAPATLRIAAIDIKIFCISLMQTFNGRRIDRGRYVSLIPLAHPPPLVNPLSRHTETNQMHTFE